MATIILNKELSTKLLKHFFCAKNIVIDDTKISFIEPLSFENGKWKKIKGVLISYTGILVFASKRKFGKFIRIITLSDVEKVGYIDNNFTKLIIFLKDGKEMNFSRMSLKKAELLAKEIDKIRKPASV